MAAMKSLRVNSVINKWKIEMNAVAGVFRRRWLVRRVLRSLKVNLVRQRSENAYSRRFAVFTAWKS